MLELRNCQVSEYNLKWQEQLTFEVTIRELEWTKNLDLSKVCPNTNSVEKEHIKNSVVKTINLGTFSTLDRQKNNDRKHCFCPAVYILMETVARASRLNFCMESFGGVGGTGG